LEDSWFCGNEPAMSTSHRPHAPQPLLCLRVQWHLRIGIGRLHRHPAPLPERGKVKPPGLPVLRKGEIVKGILMTGLLACFQILFVTQVHAMKNARTRKPKPRPNQPPSRDRLNALGCKHFVLVRLRPERDRFCSRMSPAECMPQKSPCPTGLRGPLPAHRRAQRRHLLWNTETCAENGKGSGKPGGEHIPTQCLPLRSSLSLLLMLLRSPSATSA
jgi:hypothetical protein